MLFQALDIKDQSLCFHSKAVLLLYLLLGYAFVEFSSVAEADAAKKRDNELVAGNLDGRYQIESRQRPDRQLDREQIDSQIETRQIVRQRPDRQLDKDHIDSQIETRQIVRQRPDRQLDRWQILYRQLDSWQIADRMQVDSQINDKIDIEIDCLIF